MTQATVGSGLTLPLTVRNASPVGLPLFVTNIYSRWGRGEWQEEQKSWERLDTGKSAPANIHTERLETSGTYRIEVLIMLATRWRWREERFAFTSSFTMTVAEPDDRGGHDIDIQGDTVGPVTVYVSDRRTQGPSDVKASSEAVELVLTRADSAERQFGLRGNDDGLITPKTARLAFRGFVREDAPPDGLIGGEAGIYRVGRDRTRPGGGQGDLRLQILDRQGQPDEARARMISRHHFDLYIECGRLMLRVQGQNGLRLNEKTLRRGDAVSLESGDVLYPVARGRDDLQLVFDFDVHAGSTNSVTITRHPAHEGA
ncbi:MAG: FHA domain-containing protein [Pseudomonadota bacterium]